VRFAPYIAGDRLSHADCAAVFHLPIAALACQDDLRRGLADRDSRHPGYLAMMQARPRGRGRCGAREQATPAFIAAVKKKFGLA
jgi:glutathione S-transferase